VTIPVTVLLTLAAVAPALALWSPGTVPAQRHDTDAVLAAASAYMDQYERDVSAVVAEEDYLQRAGFRQERRLRSDFVVIRDDNFDWIEFRDVFQVDGVPVRDREQRLTNLFLKPREDAVLQARRIAEEGARYNLGVVTRTINTPLVALRFLARRNHSRSAFQIDPSKRPGRDGTVAFQFREHAMPRMVRTPDDSPAHGTFWIDPGSGRVAATDLRLATRGSSVHISVTFAEDPRLKLWLPSAMDERYWTDRGSEITGRARYSNFRQFRVDTSTNIGKQP
jgi:hypothetical protein